MFLKAICFLSCGLCLKMEDGQTLFDYNVGLNDIVQLLIRSQTDAPDSPTIPECESVASTPCPPAVITIVTPTSPSAVASVNNSNSDSSNSQRKSCSLPADNQPSTSSKSFLIDPGIGLYKVRH